jgi:hypothetical protein
LAIILLILGIDTFQRFFSISPSSPQPLTVTLAPGSIPVYYHELLIAGFSAADLEKLNKTSFVDAEEGKTQEGWLLKDILQLYIQPEQLQSNAQITVSSSSRKKSAALTWAEVSLSENMVLLSTSNRGTLKLVSKIERLDAREEWVQDVDKIEVKQP